MAGDHAEYLNDEFGERSAWPDGVESATKAAAHGALEIKRLAEASGDQADVDVADRGAAGQKC